MINFSSTTCSISKGLNIIGRHLFCDSWTGEEPDADPEKDPDRYKRLNVARRELRKGLYHGHVLAWWVTLEGERKHIPPDAWGPDGRAFAGCFLDAHWRKRFHRRIDEMISRAHQWLMHPDHRSYVMVLRTLELTDQPARGVNVYVDRAALEKHLRENEKRQPPDSPSPIGLKPETREKYQHWYDLAQEMKMETKSSDRTVLVHGVRRKLEKECKPSGGRTKRPNVHSIHRRLNELFPGWADSE